MLPVLYMHWAVETCQHCTFDSRELFILPKDFSSASNRPLFLSLRAESPLSSPTSLRIYCLFLRPPKDVLSNRWKFAAENSRRFQLTGQDGGDGNRRKPMPTSRGNRTPSFTAPGRGLNSLLPEGASKKRPLNETRSYMAAVFWEFG